MSNSIRVAVIGLIGAVMVPSLCSAQLIILHENWHGLGVSKPSTATARRNQQRSIVKQHDKRLSRATQAVNPDAQRSHALERVAEQGHAPVSVAERGHAPVTVAEHRFHASSVMPRECSSDRCVDPARVIMDMGEKLVEAREVRARHRSEQAAILPSR